MVFMAQIEKVLFDSEASSSSADEKISEVSYYLSESKSESEYETSEYYDNSANYGLFVNNDDDEEIFHDAIDSASENFIENHIDPQKDYDKSDVDHNDSEEKDQLVDKLIRKFNKKIVKCQNHLDTFSSVRRPKNGGVIWKKKGSSNTSNVGLSADCVSNLNKNVKRYSRKDLLACNNSHLGETRSDFICNDAMNVSCDFRINDLLDDNNFFIFDDVNVRISHVSKMPFKKKPRDSMHVRSKGSMIKSLPRTVHKWLPKLQPLAEPVAKWFPRIVQICLWIIDSGCSKHMTGNRSLLMNFMEKFLGTARFGNNDFAVIAGYGDVHMTGNRALLTNFVEKFLGTVCFGNNVFTVIAGYGEE
nr:retrovirus-related Pol polyprotein from transposon TNT 1-94 [Tanacetum cinerariifolium]